VVKYFLFEHKRIYLFQVNCFIVAMPLKFLIRLASTEPITDEHNERKTAETVSRK